MAYKILVVDDEAPVRDLFVELLGSAKHTVKTAKSAEDALRMIDQDVFDAVLLDINLSGMSGMEALQKIKAKQPSPAVIMITGLGYDDALITQSKASGCSGYIGKNMPISQIMSSFNMFMKNALP